MAALAKGKRPGQFVDTASGAVTELIEQAENFFYDTVQTANGAVSASTKKKFFDVTANKEINHSSFTTAHKLIGIDEFTLQSIGIAMLQALGATVLSPNDYLFAAWNSSLEFKINRRQVTKGPLAFYSAGIGVTGGIASTKNDVDRAALTNGVAAAGSVRKLKVEQPIVGEVDVLEAEQVWNDNAWLAAGASATTIVTAAPGLGVMFVGAGIELNGLGK